MKRFKLELLVVWEKETAPLPHSATVFAEDEKGAVKRAAAILKNINKTAKISDVLICGEMVVVKVEERMNKQ